MTAEVEQVPSLTVIVVAEEPIAAAADVSVPVSAPVLLSRVKPGGRPTAEYVKVLTAISEALTCAATVSPTTNIGRVGRELAIWLLTSHAKLALLA